MRPECVWYWETREDYVKSEGRLGGTKTAEGEEVVVKVILGNGWGRKEGCERGPSNTLVVGSTIHRNLGLKGRSTDRSKGPES